MFFVKIVERMQHVDSETGYNAVVHYLDESGDEVKLAGQLCRERKPMGLIFLGGSLEIFKKTLPKSPCRLYWSTTRRKALTSIICPVSVSMMSRPASKAINYLIEHGHRQIGIIGGNPKLSHISQQRLCRLSVEFCRTWPRLLIADLVPEIDLPL